MSTNTAGSNKSHDSRIGQEIDALVDTVTDALADTDADSETIDAVEEQGEQVAQAADTEIEQLERRIEDNAGDIESNAEQIEDQQDEIQDHREHVGKQTAELNQRVATVEETIEGSNSEDETPTPEAEETSLQEPETPLEDIVQLPEHVVSESLSANQQRSRFVAKDVNQYSRSVPAGRAIKSSELRRVLSARDDGDCHTQTVQRVMEQLDDLGGDDVAIKETQQGEKVVVFSDEIVQRIQRYDDNHAVVAEQGVST